MENTDQNIGPVASGLVLLAAVLFTTNVYLTYSAEQEQVVYDEANAAYEQAASVMLGVRAMKAQVQASTTEEVVEEEVKADLQ